MNIQIKDITFKEVIFNKLILDPKYFDPFVRITNILDIFSISSEYPFETVIQNFKNTRPIELKLKFQVKSQYSINEIGSIAATEDTLIIIRYLDKWRNKSQRTSYSFVDYILYNPKSICIIYPCKVICPELPIDPLMIYANNNNELVVVRDFDNPRITIEHINYLCLYFKLCFLENFIQLSRPSRTLTSNQN